MKRKTKKKKVRQAKTFKLPRVAAIDSLAFSVKTLKKLSEIGNLNAQKNRKKNHNFSSTISLDYMKKEMKQKAPSVMSNAPDSNRYANLIMRAETQRSRIKSEQFVINKGTKFSDHFVTFREMNRFKKRNSSRGTIELTEDMREISKQSSFSPLKKRKAKKIS